MPLPNQRDCRRDVEPRGVRIPEPSFERASKSEGGKQDVVPDRSTPEEVGASVLASPHWANAQAQPRAPALAAIDAQGCARSFLRRPKAARARAAALAEAAARLGTGALAPRAALATPRSSRVTGKMEVFELSHGGRFHPKARNQLSLAFGLLSTRVDEFKTSVGALADVPQSSVSIETDTVSFGDFEWMKFENVAAVDLAKINEFASAMVQPMLP